MYDLETLRLLNERATIASRKLVNEKLGQPVATTPEPVFPLAVLATKLLVGPPSLSRLIDLVLNYDSIVEFLELVREYLPEHEGEIMAQGEEQSRIERFCSLFGNRYFPLADLPDYGDDSLLSDFLQYIPVELMGFAYDDYEEFNSFRDGFILLLAVVESPYAETSRVPLLERVKELVGKDLLALIPPEGWSLDDIHRMLDGTEYEGCVAFADWVHNNTDCWQLDANHTDYGPEFWSRDIVDGLTRQWPTVMDLQDKMHRMFEWLEEDVHHNFSKLLSTIRGTEYEEVPVAVAKEQIPFPLDDDGQVM